MPHYDPAWLDRMLEMGSRTDKSLAPWQWELLRSVVRGETVVLMPRQHGLSGLLELESDSGPVEVVVPVVEVEDGDAPRADEESDHDEHRAEQPLPADEAHDAGDHQSHGDEP